MKNSLRALLTGAIDYAGLFPPASLSLEETVRNYLAYKSQPEAWMLGRLVCPAARLQELALLVKNAQDKLHVAALVRGANNAEQFTEQLQGDLTAIGESSKQLEIDAVEFRFPVNFALSNVHDRTLELSMIDAHLCEQRPHATSYFELSDWPTATSFVEWRRVSEDFIASIASYNRENVGNRRSLGFKLRTGGVEAAAFPTSAQIALVTIACRDAGISWKATAGLHHPLRYYDAKLRATMHGFLNVLFAAVLADACNLSLAEVQSILDEERAESFQFDDERLRFHDWQANAEQITAARKKSLVSFGSCSFDEPRQDLGDCGLM